LYFRPSFKNAVIKHKEQTPRISDISNEICLESKTQDNLYENLLNLQQNYEKKEHEIETLEEDQVDFPNQQTAMLQESENVVINNQEIENAILDYKTGLDEIHEKHKPMIQMIENCQNDIKIIMDTKLDSEDQAYSRMLKENQNKTRQGLNILNKTRDELASANIEKNIIDKAQAVYRRLILFINECDTILADYDQKEENITQQRRLKHKVT
jgi:hypothetical protein